MLGFTNGPWFLQLGDESSGALYLNALFTFTVIWSLSCKICENYSLLIFSFLLGG